MGKKGVCKEDSCSWESGCCLVMREEACIKKGNRDAVVFWSSQYFLERSMWDGWPSPTLLKGRKVQRISPGRHIARQQSWGFYVISWMEGSVHWIWLWKKHIRLLLLPFLLGFLRRADGLSEVCPPCWFASPVCREERFLAGWYDNVAWAEGAVRAGRRKSLAPCLLQRNFNWEMCLTLLSPNSLLWSSLPEKLWRERPCLSRLVLLHLFLPQELLWRDLWCGTQRDLGLGWTAVQWGLNLGRESPTAPIRNELECFVLVSDTFLSKHPWVPVMCN